VRVVPSWNAPTRVHPTFTLQPEKSSRIWENLISSIWLGHKKGILRAENLSAHHGKPCMSAQRIGDMQSSSPWMKLVLNEPTTNHNNSLFSIIWNPKWKIIHCGKNEVMMNATMMIPFNYYSGMTDVFSTLLLTGFGTEWVLFKRLNLSLPRDSGTLPSWASALVSPLAHTYTSETQGFTPWTSIPWRFNATKKQTTFLWRKCTRHFTRHDPACMNEVNFTNLRGCRHWIP
jgi:hypothetical protein